MASLFLVLTLCAFVLQRPVSAGVNMPLAKVVEIPAEKCFSGLSDRDIVLQIKNDGTTRINETDLEPATIRERLSEIYENREERFLFLLVDPNVPYREFADVYDQAASSTPGLQIGLLTRQLRNDVDNCPEGSGCTIQWPNEPGNIYCRNLFRPVLVPLHSPLASLRSRR